MNELFQNFQSYIQDAQFDTLVFWIFPVGTVLVIWMLAIIGLKLFSGRNKLKTVFIIHRAWLISSLSVSFILVSLICYWWTQNFFSDHPYQLSLIISLIISLFIPIIVLLNLRTYYTPDKIKEITVQPKTANELNKTISFTKRIFRYSKIYFLIPVVGFIFLLLYFYKGTNLIALVFDNSGSMTETTAIDALYETFENLEENNEIILTTLDGPNYLAATNTTTSNAKTSINELMRANRSIELNAGKIIAFSTPAEAKDYLYQISGFDCCSPIGESIWKTYLYAKENNSTVDYKNKLLIVITDGLDSYIDQSIDNGNFFYNDAGFIEFFQPENTFIIDFSNGEHSKFMEVSHASGIDVYPAENNKQAYLDALDNALQSFKNNWYLIYWILIIFGLFSIVGLMIQPKKII